MASTLELVLLYLVAAVLGVVACRSLKLPPMLGYLVVGVLIGPNALAFAQDSAGVKYLAEFGVVFLMFVIGLEFNLPKLRSMRTLVFGLGLSQVVLTILGALAGNLLLDRLYGATVRLVPSIDPMLAVGQDEAVVAEVVAEEEASSRTPYVIPIGGSSGVGVLGYVGGTAELVEQLATMNIASTRLYYASGSRGTQAGLTLGAKLCEAPYRVYGVAVSAGEPEKIERAKRIGNEAATRLGLSERLDLPDLVTDQSFIGEGYGIPAEAGLEAIALVARTEALLLDPCYTSKGMAALIQHVRSGELSASETVVFLHTGGMPALFTAGFVESFTRHRR